MREDWEEGLRPGDQPLHRLEVGKCLECVRMQMESKVAGGAVRGAGGG